MRRLENVGVWKRKYSRTRKGVHKDTKESSADVGRWSYSSEAGLGGLCVGINLSGVNHSGK